MYNFEIVQFHGSIKFVLSGDPLTMSKTEIIYPKNVGASIAMNFT